MVHWPVGPGFFGPQGKFITSLDIYPLEVRLHM
jgi:hypothetical protein